MTVIDKIQGTTIYNCDSVALDEIIKNYGKLGIKPRVTQDSKYIYIEEVK